ncbi:coiled-coil domain-containing protein 141 isoform X2 [Pelobates fuscus]|uniref:coiled-coil domain-containing protein 141 isoform X2 n=1 Tax=Pelobates fuscus TaxID=191477 RepID=UPI002FE4CDA0
MSNEKDFVEQFSTTTVSTVAIQAGESRIVVAVLKCGELVNLQLSEAVPNLLDIGNNLEESKKLLEDHELLLSKLKSLEDQVWDLLCEADKTADENKDQERVYDAMASTLKDAWDTLIAVLEKRRTLLHLAADFFRIALEFSTSIDRAEDFLQNTSGQESTDNITECFNQLQSHTKALLERSLHLLNKSHELTEFIDLFKSNQSIAYCQIARGARVSCSKIDNLLEFLQDRRRQLDKRFKQLRSRLEQTLQVSQWNQEEDKVTCWLKKHIEVYLKTDVLGSSLTENDELLHKHKQFVLNAKEWTPVIEKLKREAARLVAMVDCPEKEYILTSNDKLNALNAEFWKLVDQRQNILHEANNFFKSVNKAFDKLGNIEMHLKHLRTEEPGSPGGEVETEIRKCTAEAFQRGQVLINKCSNSSGMTGIQEMIGYLQKRVDQLTGHSHTSTEYNVKKHSLLTSLEEHLRKVSMLIQKINSELERYSDPGCTINECEEVLNKLVELSNLTKEASQNMEAAAQLLKEVTQNAPTEAHAFITNAHFLDEKLNILDQTIEEKLEVLNVYTTFLISSKELNSHIQSLKKMYTSNPEERPMSIEDSADAQLQRVVNEFFSVRDMGQNCLNIIKMMSKNTVLKESHVQTVESTMDNLIKEKAELAIFLSGWQQHSNQIKKSSKQQWKTIEEQLRSASNKLQELENDLQPFSLLCLGDNLQNILIAQEKLNSIKDTFQKLNTETEHAAKMSELLNREQTTVMDASGKINDLAQHYQRVNGSIMEYEALLIKIGTFYKFKTELEILVRSTQEPPKPPEVNDDVQLHKTIEQQTHITSLYNLIRNLGTEIISTAQCSKYITIPIKDFQQQLNLLENERRDQDFKQNKQEEKALTNPNFGEALHDVKELNESFKDVKKKFNNLKFNYSKKADKGRNLKLIKNQILQVEMYAEKMQVLKKKIDNLEKKTFTGVVSQQADKADVFKEAVCDLLKKVNDFNFVVEEYKQNLEMAEDLQHIMEECQFWSEEACATVVRVGRYSAECKTVEAIEILLKQFNKFVEPTVPQQEERIQEMTNIASHIYGPDEGMKYIEKTITKHKESIHSVNDLYIYLKELEEKLQEPCKMLETPTNPASEELSSQPIDLPSSAKDDPAKSCQRHMVTQEAIKSVSEKHSSVNVAGQTSGFSKPLPNITVKEGSPVTLEVEVTSCPEPTLTWFQKEHKHSTDYGEESKNTLVIREVCKKDPDQYIAHTSICRNSFSSIDGIRWEDDRSPLSEIDWITLLFVYLCISLTYWLFTN